MQAHHLLGDQRKKLDIDFKIAYLAAVMIGTYSDDECRVKNERMGKKTFLYLLRKQVLFRLIKNEFRSMQFGNARVHEVQTQIEA
jgi:hypothetical protein